MGQMRASRVVEKHKIVCEQVDIVPPQNGEVVVKTSWAAICGSDVHVLHSDVPLMETAFRPGAPGHEGIGHVAESTNPAFQEGELVLTVPVGDNRTGTFADYLTMKPNYMIKIPETDIPQEQLLMAQQFGTTIFSLRQMPVDVVGKTVMVMGQGSAGCFFANSLKRAGAAKVIVSDKSEVRMANSRHFGADVVVKAEGKNVYEAVMDHTGGEGVDYLVEAVGSSEALAESISLIRTGGHGLYFGQPDTDKLVPFNFYEFQRKRMTINATRGTQQEPNLASFKRALDLILTKQVDVSPLITHVFPLDQIEEAMAHAAELQRNACKVVFRF